MAKISQVDTIVPVEPRKGMLKLKNINGSWQWVKQENTFLANMGFEKEAGNMTANISDSDFFSISSVYIVGSNILKIASENASNISDSASIGSGNSNPVLRIIYKTNEEVKAIVSTKINFDGIPKEINYNAVFNASETLDTLFVSLNELQHFDINAKGLLVENVRFLYPITTSFRLNLIIKEIAYGAMDLIRENDIVTGTRYFAGSNPNRLIIYPNPATNIVSVNLSGNKIEKLFIYNSLGECFKEIFIFRDTLIVDINIEEYSSGLYYVSAESKDNLPQNRYVGMFIKH